MVTKKEVETEAARIWGEFFPSDYPVEIKYSRMSDVFGTCQVFLRPLPGAVVTISTKALKLLTREHVMQTVRHEMAHALGFIRSGKIDHGPEWAQACQDIGCEARKESVAPDSWYRYITHCTECKKEFFKFQALTIKRQGLIIHGKCPYCQSVGMLKLYDSKHGQYILRGRNLNTQREAA